MKKVKIKRGKSTSQGTPGVLFISEKEFCKTLELPWLGNAPQISSIPEGVYICRWTWSNAFKRFMYLITRVPNRSGIRIHSGNFAGMRRLGYKTHVLGCILLGARLGEIQNQLAILSSRATVSKFERELDKEPFELWIS